MKNLKKVLSLILAVAMVCSFMVFASAKDYEEFTDAADISEKYIEAVDVISALNIFVGDETGALDPQGTFTRAQAAKIVAYMSIGNAAADALVKVGGIFKDVEAGTWAAGYIAYAYNAGILNGDTGEGGYFRPDDAVTGAEVAKLMNTVLGYGKMGEYVGPSWQINAISDGVQRGLVVNVDDLTAPALREEVIQAVFNTIHPARGNSNRMVEYSNVINGYVYADGTGGTNANTNSAKTTLGAFIFNLSWNYRVDKVDGTPSHYWIQYNKEITGLYSNGPATVVSTNGTPIGGDSGLLTTNNLIYSANAGVVTASFYINGKVSTQAAVELAAQTVGAKISIYTRYDADISRTIVTHIAVINKTVAKVLANPVTSNGVTTAIPGIPTPGFGKAYIGGTDVAKDDIVLYYQDGNDNIHVNKAATVEGNLTRYIPSPFMLARLDTITFAGETYFISALEGTLNTVVDRTAFATTSGNFNTAAVVWLDDFNNVVRLEVGTILRNYVYAYGFSNDGFGTPGSGAAVRGKLVKTDGTIVVAAVKTSAAEINAAGQILVGETGEWFSYVESDGVYTLTRVPAIDTPHPTTGSDNGYGASFTATAAITEAIVSKNTTFYKPAVAFSGLAAITGIYASNDTVFIYLDNDKEKTAVYTGINNVAKADLAVDDKVSVISTVAGGKAARYVLIEKTALPTGVATVAYFTQGTPVYTAPSGDYVYEFAGVILDGNLLSDNFKTDNGLAQGPGLYEVTRGDNDVYTVGAAKIGFEATGIINSYGRIFTDIANPTFTPTDISTSAAIFTLENGPLKLTDSTLFANTTADGPYYDYTYYVDTTGATDQVTHIYATLLSKVTSGVITSYGPASAYFGTAFYINDDTSKMFYAGTGATNPWTGAFTPVIGATVTFWYSAAGAVRYLNADTGGSLIAAADARIDAAVAAMPTVITADVANAIKTTVVVSTPADLAAFNDTLVAYLKTLTSLNASDLTFTVATTYTSATTVTSVVTIGSTVTGSKTPVAAAACVITVTTATA